MDEQTFVRESVLAVFRKNGYADLARMTQRDFDHIGDEIEKRSGILISGTTIKRLAYGEFSRLPQIATLNAIANYFDHKTWQDYRSAAIQPAPIAEAPNKPDKQKHILKYIYIVGGIVLLAGIYFFVSPKRTVTHIEKASFTFHKNTSNEIPNTVVFNYNIDEVQADSFFIQQSWDKNRRIRVYKKNYTLTDIYYEPGFHLAKLIANDSVIKIIEVSIPTDGWCFYAIDNIANYTPEYIKTAGFIKNGALGLTVPQLLENKIDIKKDKLYHYVYFPERMDVPGDNFKLTTRVRMKEVRNNTCPYITLEVFCQRYYMIMKSTTGGCAHQAGLQFGEHGIRGKDADLAPVTFDVSQWTDVEITVKNKLATIYINGKQVFSTQYRNDTKNIAGLAFISNGLCEVDHVAITGLDGKVMYKSEF